MGKDGNPLVRHGTQCVDLSPMPPEMQAVADAKLHAAEVYADYRDGRATKAELDEASAKVEELTGVSLAEPRRNAVANSELLSGDASPGGVQAMGSLPIGVGGFRALRQINGYYCGPASAQSILYYFGSAIDPQYKTSATYDTVTNAYDVLNGNAVHDQTILANDFWLATDMYGGTNWGALYQPFTLNNWRGDSWYSQHASAGAGGSLSASTLLTIIDFDVDHEFPVLENVRYVEPESYLPDGFATGGDFWHWDTLYGTFTSGGDDYVRIGQVYASPGLPYDAYQSKSLDEHFDAVNIGHGVVW